MKRKIITTIFFDIDNTLLDHSYAEKQALTDIYSKYFSQNSKKKFHSIWIESTKTNWKLYENKILTFKQQRNKRIIDVWKYFNQSIDESRAEEIFNEYLQNYEKSWKPFPYLISTFKKLHKQNINLGIITNGNTEQQYKKINFLKIFPYLKTNLINISEAIGHSKPSREIFIHAQKNSGKQSDEIMFVGDNQDHDIFPAKRLGWNTLLVNHSGSTQDIDMVSSLKEILAHVS